MGRKDGCAGLFFPRGCAMDADQNDALPCALLTIMSEQKVEASVQDEVFAEKDQPAMPGAASWISHRCTSVEAWEDRFGETLLRDPRFASVCWHSGREKPSDPCFIRLLSVQGSTSPCFRTYISWPNHNIAA